VRLNRAQTRPIRPGLSQDCHTSRGRRSGSVSYYTAAPSLDTGCRSGKHALKRARSVGSPCAGRMSSTRRSSNGRSRWTTSSRVTCLRPPSWMSSPSPKSESESPVTIALIEGSHRMRSLSSRPAYAWTPNGHAPGPWTCPSPSPARSQASPHSPLSAGGVCTGRPSPRASRSWYGAVRTTDGVLKPGRLRAPGFLPPPAVIDRVSQSES
jgi:hypothetical protein